MKTTLHLLIHARHYDLAKVVMQPGDDVILAGESLLIDPTDLVDQRVFALQSDCGQWGLPGPVGVTSLTDADWVARTAAAERVIVW